MARMIQNNFSGGEISPCLYGRSDLQAYYKGCAKAENFIVSKEGTLRKRHGLSSMFALGEADYSRVRIFPYTYDRTQSGFIVLAASGADISATLYGKDGTQKNTATIPNAIDEDGDVPKQMADIQAKQIGDQVWLTGGSFGGGGYLEVTDNSSVSYRRWGRITNVSPVLSISAAGCKADGSSYNPTSGRTIHYAAYVVKDGVMSERMQASVTWPASWQAGYYIVVTVKFDPSEGFDYILLGKRVGGTFGEVSRWYPEDAGDSGSVTFRDENISAGSAIYAQTDVLGEGFGAPWCVDCFQQRRAFANAWTREKVTVRLGTSSRSYEPPDGIFRLVSAKKSGSSAEFAGECTVSGGVVTFPSSGKWTVSYISGTVTRLPMTLWFSEAGNLDNFFASRPASDSDPFSPTIASTGPSFIRWIASYQEMLVLFTESGIFSVGFSQTSGFSASSCRIARVSALSVSSTVAPVVTDAGVVFVGADEKTVYTASYDLQENMLKPVNRSVLVEHLTRTSRIRRLALQDSPDNVVWAVLDDGRYATFTFERNEEVYAWSEGFVEGAEILDVISLGSVTDSDTDRTYGDMVFAVKKGGTVYLCRPNAGHADVIGGASANVAATLTTLRPESQERTIVGTAKNVKDVLLRLYRTGSIAAKPAGGGADLPLVAGRMAHGADGLFTGDVKIMPRGLVNEDGQMTYVSADDRPCEILQVVTTLEVE